MTVKNNTKPYHYRVEDIACKLNESVQIMHYITQELEDYKLPEDREPTLDDMYARVQSLCYRTYEDIKAVREDLYKLFDDMR